MQMQKLPAPRYDVFIRLLQQEALEAEKRMLRLASLESLYELVRNTLEDMEVLNATLRFNEYSEFYRCVSITISAKANDSMSEFDAIAAEIGTRLRLAGHHDGVPTVTDESPVWPCKEFEWKIPDGSHIKNVCLHVILPTDGIADVEVVAEQRQTTAIRYKLQKRVNNPVEPIEDQDAPTVTDSIL